MSGQYSTQALAYLGDCVIEMCVRSLLVESGISHSSDLNSAALDFVRAGAQAEAVKKIIPLLDDEENAVFHRGRNVGHTNTPKSASVGQYRAATGMEALFGKLWLDGNHKRVSELFLLAYKDKITELKGKHNEHTKNHI